MSRFLRLASAETMNSLKTSRLRCVVIGIVCISVTGCAGPREFLRPGTSAAEADAQYAQCRDVAEERYSNPVYAGAPGNIATGVGTGMMKGASEVIAKYRMTGECMSERGFVLADVSPEEEEILEGPDTPEREALVAELYARGDSE
ncbi:hypothetical protein [Jiella marina]|uniref:hypothetical protein n=1 Tax=Jiella sp. LLJ827 TaxID=2917712 RepID=UPI0021013CB8|nr:hypothetical protein [Jiella sp. LLJ827]MCQ0987292.1 hypothetical protein [Jiella sp. LLJ827]